MSRNERLLRFRFLFEALLTIAAFSTGLFGLSPTSGVIIGILIVVAVVLAYLEYDILRIQPESSALQAVLEDKILPAFMNEYGQIWYHPEVRMNVMILRRRNLNPIGGRNIPPWEKTLKIESSVGDYSTTLEDALEWRTSEGVVGAATNDRAQEVWLVETDADIQATYNLTDEQYERTNGLKSVLSVPIYLPSDKNKNTPVGVLNIDSEAPLDDTQLSSNEFREIAIYYANIIGAVVE